jgi:hypothetical protein
MTPNKLLENLKAFIEGVTGDIVLPVRPVNNKTIPAAPRPKKTAAELAEEKITHRAPEVHLMRLPDKDAETNRVPYIILQYLAGKDEHKPNEQADSIGNVRIIVATYSDNDSEGALDVLTVLTRVRVALLKAGEIGKQFLLRKPLDYLVYPDDTQPYFFGEMMTVWEMPIILREVHTHYVERE